jgi:hypothetical protein
LRTLGATIMQKGMWKQTIPAIPTLDHRDYILGEVDFWIFWIFNFLQFAIDGKSYSKTKVEKVFFFIFMPSYVEMSF